MKKHEYKQIVSLLLVEVKALKRRDKALKNAALLSKMSANSANSLLVDKNKELVKFAARNAELSSQNKALRARESEVSALRQQHAETYTSKLSIDK